MRSAPARAIVWSVARGWRIRGTLRRHQPDNGAASEEPLVVAIEPAEMSGMFAPDGRPRIDKRLLVAKADELDRTIRKLSAIREGLRHAAVCRAPSHMECPTFQRILRTTAARKPRPARKPPR